MPRAKAMDPVLATMSASQPAPISRWPPSPRAPMACRCPGGADLGGGQEHARALATARNKALGDAEPRHVARAAGEGEHDVAGIQAQPQHACKA